VDIFVDKEILSWLKSPVDTIRLRNGISLALFTTLAAILSRGVPCFVHFWPTSTTSLDSNLFVKNRSPGID
jgi:hypothetical protein